jgi:threonine aldolase
MFCLSKGLVSPIGSMLVGTRKFITRARHLRKMLGGGMRQVGVVAAAGVISLEKMIDRLKDDHARARKLADGLRKIKGVLVDSGSPYTNMVYLNLDESVSLNGIQISDEMKNLGVLVDIENSRRFRLVTHYWVDDKAVDIAIKAFAKVLS